MLLLDIILEPRRVPDTARLSKPIVRDTLSVPSDTTDTVASSANMLGGNQQVADVAPHPTGILGMAGDHILLTVFVVLVALSLCFYFVRKYRKQYQSGGGH